MLADRTRRRRLQELHQVVTKELAAPYTVKYVPDTGQLVLTPETRVVVAVPPEPTMEERLIMAVWRIGSLHLSRTQSRYLVGSMTYGVVWDQVYGMLRQLALPESRAFTAYTGDDTTIHGAACCLPNRIGHLYQCRPPPPSDIMQPGNDGCIGCLLRWMVHRGVRPRTSIARLVAPPAPTNYLVGGYWCADEKAQVLMAGCHNWKAESPGATACWVYMRNRAVCLATFGTASAIDGNWEGTVAIGAIYRTITCDRRVPDCGLHGV